MSTFDMYNVHTPKQKSNAPKKKLFRRRVAASWNVCRFSETSALPCFMSSKKRKIQAASSIDRPLRLKIQMETSDENTICEEKFLLTMSIDQYTRETRV